MSREPGPGHLPDLAVANTPPCESGVVGTSKRQENSLAATEGAGRDIANKIGTHHFATASDLPSDFYGPNFMKLFWRCPKEQQRQCYTMHDGRQRSRCSTTT